MLVRHITDRGIILDTNDGSVLWLWHVDSTSSASNHVDEFGFLWDDAYCTTPHNPMTATTKCSSVDEFWGADPLEFDWFE